MRLRLPPIASATLAFAIGLPFGFRAPDDLLSAALAIAALLALGSLLAPLASRLLPLLAFAAAGLASGLAAAARVADDCRLRIPDGARIVVRGAFEARVFPDAAAPFRLEEIRVGPKAVRCEGTVRARLAGRGRTLPAGAEVLARGRWLAIPADGPWPRSPERAGTLILDSVRILAPPAGGHHPLLAARGAAQERLRTLFPSRAPVAEALLLAQQDGIDPELRQRYARSGLAHLLAISGSHVTFIAGSLFLLCRLVRLAHRPAAVVVGIVTTGYVLFIGAPYPAARAAIFVLLLLAARVRQQPADPLALLAATALALLAFDPTAALDAGFQLSFAGVLGLLTLYRRFLAMIPARVARILAESVATSLAATVATAPVCAFHFGTVAPVGILANILAVPLATAALPALALAMAASFLAWPIGHFLAGAGDLLLAALDAVATAAAAIPFGTAYVPRDSLAAWAGAAALFLLIARARPADASARRPGDASRRRRRTILLATAASLALLTAWPWLVRQTGDGKTLEIHAIDVGQGDAFAIRSPAGRWILVDAGPRTDRFDAGRVRVVPFLLRHGARRLEAFVLTHPDADHIGGAAAVLEAFDVGLIVDPGLSAGKPLYLSLLAEARRRGTRWIAARPGRELRLDDVVLEFLYPEEEMLDTATEANEASAIFRLRYGQFAMLFLGDAPAAVEQRLVHRAASALRVNALKVAHHGSATSTSDELLEATRPEVALISVGRHNRYGHPDPRVLERLARAGIQVFRTDRHGAILLRIHPSGRWEAKTTR